MRGGKLKLISKSVVGQFGQLLQQCQYSLPFVLLYSILRCHINNKSRDIKQFMSRFKSNAMLYFAMSKDSIDFLHRRESKYDSIKYFKC